MFFKQSAHPTTSEMQSVDLLKNHFNCFFSRKWPIRNCTVYVDLFLSYFLLKSQGDWKGKTGSLLKLVFFCEFWWIQTLKLWLLRKELVQVEVFKIEVTVLTALQSGWSWINYGVRKRSTQITSFSMLQRALKVKWIRGRLRKFKCQCYLVFISNI